MRAIIIVVILITWAATVVADASDNASPNRRIADVRTVSPRLERIEAWANSPARVPATGSRQSVGSVLSPDDGIGKGVSVDRTYDDGQYTEGCGRHITHWWNGEYGVEAEVSVHFGYRAMDDTASNGAYGLSGYNMFDATVAPDGDWPRFQDWGCELQSADTIGWGGIPSLDIMPNGRVIMAAMSHLGNGFLGDASAFVDNMVYYQGTEFGCTYIPGLNAISVDSTVYRQHFLDQSEGYYVRNPQVVTQWDGSNTVVHLLLGEGSEGVTLSGDDYCDYTEYYAFTYYRKIGDQATAGIWSAGQIIDSLWFPWASMAAAPYPYQNVVVTYTNQTWSGALLNNQYDLDVWYRESLDRGLTWQEAENMTNYQNWIGGDPNHFTAWLETQALYSDDGDLHIIWTATPTSADPYFDGFTWIGFQINLYHWAKSTDEIAYVATGVYYEYPWWGHPNYYECGFGGRNATYISNINIGQCDDKLYCVWNQIHERANRFDWRSSPNPQDGVWDDCAYTGESRGSMANWEILMSVARLSTSWLWDGARNISDTYTPNCGLPGDPEASGPCGSEYKPSLERYGLDESGLDLHWPEDVVVDLTPADEPPYSGSSYLNLQYLDDQNPGPSFAEWWANPPATYNSIKWIRLACVEPIEEAKISVQPLEFVWPQWVELGQADNLTVTVINDGNVAMNVAEIGHVETTGSNWLSTSVNPSPGTPFVVPAGATNTATFDIVIDASGLSSSAWLDGEVWLKSDAVNDDSVSIMLHLLAAANVEPVVWDTVMTHANMFDIDLSPEGECVALAVGNNGELGWSTGGGGLVNLDYVESETECGARVRDGIYLFGASAFTIMADDASGANARLTQSFKDPDQADETGWDPVGDRGSITGGLTAGGDYDSVYTGRFVNRDTSIAMERIFYAPRSDDPENEIINFVVCATKIYSGDGQAHDHLTVGNVVDWDVPSEDVPENTSGRSSVGFVYMQGTDTTGVLSCQSHTDRFATEAFGGSYTSAEFQAAECVNGSDFHSVNALSQLFMEDTSSYRDGTPLVPSQPNPEVWWQETSSPGLNADATVQDNAVWLTYAHDYNLGAQDTLYYWTVLTTVRDGTLADLRAQVSYARCWYTETVRGCTCGCCVDRVGNANGTTGPNHDEPTIGDVSVMIDAKFISGTCVGILDCLTEADINQSGGSGATCDDITIGDISVLIDYLFITGSSLGLNDCL